VNLFEERGYEKLIESLKHRANTLRETPPSDGSPPTPVPSDSLTNDPPVTNDPPGRLQSVLDSPADIVFFTFNLLCHPIKTVLSRLADNDDRRRFRQAFYYLVAMLCVYSVIEIILLYHSGFRDVRLFYFLVEIATYLFISFINAAILHVFLKMFRVQSDLLHTLPCFFYYAAIVIPIYAVLNYFPDLVEYKVVEKAGIGILLQPSEWSRMTDELLREWGTASERAYSVCYWLVVLWTLVCLGFLAKVLGKFYQRRWLTCFLAGFLALGIISLIETFGVKPVSTKVLYLLSQTRPDVTK
jgi:hypothetical protein